MAIFHCEIKIIGGGKSAVAASAYRSGEKLKDEQAEKVKDYTHKEGVEYSRVLLPENAPEELADRETLWNKVQAAEMKSKHPQYAREVEVALPVEMTREQQIKALEEYVKEQFTTRGMIADINLHDTGNGNPHAHIMLTMRPLKENGEFDAKRRDVYANDRDQDGKPIYNPEKPSGKENRIPALDKDGNQKKDKKGAKVWERVKVETTDWNNRENAEKWREAWAKECNKYLDKDHQIDHRSLERQGIERGATIHEGYAARAREANGQKSDRCEINRQIRALNKELDKIQAQEKALDRGLDRGSRAAARLNDIVGDNAITAGFTNTGAHENAGGERWDLMTESKKDEIRWKNAIKDDYGDEEKSLMSDWKPKITQDAPDNILADLFKDNFKDKEEERSNGRGTDPDRGRDLRGRSHGTNDKRRTEFERAIQLDFTTNRRSAPERDPSEGRDDLKSFLANINSKVRGAEAGREEREAEQRRLDREREREAERRKQKTRRVDRSCEQGYSRSR